MTINQAFDKVTEIKNPNLEQQDLKLSLLNLKKKYGGKMQIENIEEVNNIITHGSKEVKTLPKDADR